MGGRKGIFPSLPYTTQPTLSTLKFGVKWRCICRTHDTVLSDNHSINKLYAGTLVDKLRKLVTTVEEVVAHNARTDANVQDAALKAHFVSEVGNMLPHYLAPELWQFALGNLACHIWSFEELLQYITY